MPQASDDLRRRAGHYTLADAHATNLDRLRERGFIVIRGTIWAPFDHSWLSSDHDAVSYLEDEWDYSFGGELEAQIMGATK